MDFEDDKRDIIISSIVSLFAHEEANSLLARSFTECVEDDYKNDCMKRVLEKVKQNRDLFVIQLESIITLHTNALGAKENLVFRLNRILSLINLKYDFQKGIISATHVPSVLLSCDEKFIKLDTRFFPDSFYNDLIEQINVTYLDGCYSATMVLLRKLFENLIIDILRKKYGTDKEKNLYWDVNRKQFLTFYTLINNFNKKINDFETYKKIDNKLIEFLNKKIRYPGNESAHSIEDKISREEMEKKKQKINDYLESLFSVLNKS